MPISTVEMIYTAENPHADGSVSSTPTLPQSRHSDLPTEDGGHHSEPLGGDGQHSFISSLSPDLRKECLITSNEAFLAMLPPHHVAVSRICCASSTYLKTCVGQHRACSLRGASSAHVCKVPTPTHDSPELARCADDDVFICSCRNKK